MTTPVLDLPCEACGRGRDIEWSDERDKLLAAIVAMQGKLEAPRKGSWNDHRGYHYADLADVFEACRKPLADAGLALLQTPGHGARGLELVTTLAHVSGQWIRCRLPILSVSDPQQMGSALTYARKYGLLTIVGLAPEGEDDDGQGAARGQGGQRSHQRSQQQRQAPREQRGQAKGPPKGQTAPRAEAKGKAEPRKADAPRTSAGPKDQDLGPWDKKIREAKSTAELRLISKEAAKTFPKDHPARAILQDALARRHTALDQAERQAAQRDPEWAGD